MRLLPEVGSEVGTGSGSESDSGGGASAVRTELQRILWFFERAARALHQAHEHGLVHRDIKPSNLIVAGDGRPVILDFGLVHAERDQGLGLTRTTDVLGTPYYMAPEQLNEGQPVTRATDVWALGVTLYECLCGERPFDGTSRERLYHEILHSEPATLRARRVRGPYDLEVVLRTALAKDPRHRYQSALDFAEDLRRLRCLEPIRARATPPLVRVWRLAQRHPVLAASLALTIVSMMTALVVTLTSRENLRQTLVTTRALGLASSASDAVATAPTRALLLALEGIGLEDRFETRSALYAAFAASRERCAFAAEGRVLAFDVSEDGSRFVTGTTLGAVQLWSAGGEALGRWQAAGPAEQRTIMRVGFLGHDRVLAAVRGSEATGGELLLLDDGLRVLDRKRLQRQVGYLTVARTPGAVDGRLIVSLDGAVAFVGLDATRARIEVVDELETPGLGVDCTVAVSADGRFVAVASQIDVTGRGVLFGKARGSGGDASFVEVGPLLDRPLRIGSLDFRGSMLAIGATGEVTVCLDAAAAGPDGAVERIEFAGGSQVGWLGDGRLVTGFLGGQPRIWMVDQGRAELVTEPDSRPSLLKRQQPVVSGDGKLFAVAYQDGTLRAFDSDSGGLVAELSGHAGMAQGLSFLPGSHDLVSWTESVRVWETRREGERHVGHGHLAHAPSATGRTARWVAGGALRDAEGRPLVEVRDRGEWSGAQTRFSSDGRYVASRSDAVRVFDTVTGEQVFDLPDDGEWGPWCMLQDTREILLFDHVAGGTRIVDYLSGRVARGPAVDLLVWRVVAHGSAFAVAARPGVLATFSRTGGGGGGETAWRMTGSVGLGTQLRCVEYSADGTKIAIGADDALVQVFDCAVPAGAVSSGAPVTLTGHRQGIRDLAFSPSGRFLASTAIDGILRVWTADGEPWAEIRTPSGIVECAFTAGGRRLQTVHRDGVLRDWPIDTAELVESARARRSRDFTPAERAQFADLLGGDRVSGR